VLLLHPFDVIKTRLQVQDGAAALLKPGAVAAAAAAAAAPPPQYRGTLDAARTILRAEGARGLYAGLAPSLVGSAFAWGAYLYMYDRIKAWHRRRLFGGGGGGAEGEGGGGGGGRASSPFSPLTAEQRLPALWNLLSAAQSGAVVCVLTNPLWLVKTRLALQCAPAAAAAAGGAAASAAVSPAARAAAAAAAAAAARPYKGMLDALARIGREEGLRGYYKGLAPSLLLQTSHGAIQFAAYEELKVLFAGAGGLGGGGGGGGGKETAAAKTAAGGSPAARCPGDPPASSSPPAPPTTLAVTAAAFASKLAAAVSTYPAQVVRARLQQRFDVLPGRPSELVYTSAVGAARVMLAREGLAGFYKGLLPSLLRVMPQSAVTLVVYERAAAALEARFGGGGGDRPAGGGDGRAAAALSTAAAAVGGDEGAGGGRRRARRSLTDEMAPLEIVGDSQAEQ